MTPRCAVLGYAGVDLTYATEPFGGPGRTTLVRHPLHDGVLPGAAAYFALGLARNGVAADLVSWVGDDENGTLFVDHHRQAGVNVEGVSRTGSRSPVTHIYWPDEGEPVVFYDPGDVDQTLTPRQRGLLATAPAVIIGVGPEAATAAALAVIPAGALVLWVVKCDPRSVPPELAVPRPVAVDDTTGAGDTFAAGLMARLTHRTDLDATDLEAAVLGACADVHALLLARKNES